MRLDTNYFIEDEFQDEKWISDLNNENPDCSLRLAECRNTKEDVLIMTKLVYRYNKDKSKEESLIHIIEWVCELNNQYEIDFTEEEYNNMLNQI